MKFNYRVYTDGSSKRIDKTWISGVAFVILDGDNAMIKKEAHGVNECTISRAEILGPLSALDYLHQNDKLEGSKVIIYSDSEYVVKSYNLWMDKWQKNNWVNGWTKTYRSHHDLFKQLHKYKYMKDCTVVFSWIPAHADVPYNEMADELAKEARTTLEL